MFSRENLEQKQILIYGVSLLLGAGFGLSIDRAEDGLSWAISPLIATLLYAMFAQIPFLKLREAISNARFMAALLVGNFIAVPILVWVLIHLFPQTPPVLIGVCLVLLTPCIDYVIVFTQLGKGNESLVLASTPILFIVQMVLLPLYLWLFIGEEMAGIVRAEPFVEAFIFLIILPLLLAIVTQVWAGKSAFGLKSLRVTAWLPVPLMALVLFVVVASQIGKVHSDLGIIVGVIPIYILFMIITPIVSRMIAYLFKLDHGAGRALIFSTGTRNSLVVLPLALALPGSFATIVAAVIVTQTIIELIGELVYIKAVPNLIMRDHSGSKADI